MVAFVSMMAVGLHFFLEFDLIVSVEVGSGSVVRLSGAYQHRVERGTWHRKRACLCALQRSPPALSSGLQPGPVLSSVLH